MRIPYFGSNGGTYPAQSLSSSGITGLTAQLNAGNLTYPAGELIYTITGTPANPGKSAVFSISIGGKTCAAELNVDIPAAHASCEPVNVLNPLLNYETMQDQDGNSYKTIQIGAQTWMAENLRTTHNNAGGTVGSSNVNSLGCRFGLIYAYEEVIMDTSGICPAGWHVPDDEEWMILENQLGGNQVALKKMISAYPQNYIGAIEGTDNSSGLSLVGGGYRPQQCPGYPPIFIVNYPCSVGSFGYWTQNEKYYFGGYFNDVDPQCPALAAIRCIKDPVQSEIAQVQNLNCSSAVNAGTLSNGNQATDVSVTLPYSGGNGGIYFSQTVSSQGVSGLTASLAPGTLQNGSGNLVWQISGTPQSSGTATFTLSLAGKTCQISFTVE